MKTIQTIVTSMAVAGALLVTSCKNEQETQAEKAVEAYVKYLDSISQVTADKAAAEWEQMEAAYEAKKAEAEKSLENLKDKTKLEEAINKANQKYEAFKDAVVVEKQKLEKAAFRNSLFTVAVNDDMNFSWVNKDNILATYDKFINTVIANKDSYSVEQWDDIKKIYEALDQRKNTVEKEGLSTGDNLKIAGLKVKFAPLFKVERADAKIDETEEAKK